MRWLAAIGYLDNTPTKVIAFDELGDLHNIVEEGPDWNTIDKIVVTLGTAPRKQSEYDRGFADGAAAQQRAAEEAVSFPEGDSA